MMDDFPYTCDRLLYIHIWPYRFLFCTMTKDYEDTVTTRHMIADTKKQFVLDYSEAEEFADTASHDNHQLLAADMQRRGRTRRSNLS